MRGWNVPRLIVSIIVGTVFITSDDPHSDDQMLASNLTIKHTTSVHPLITIEYYTHKHCNKRRAHKNPTGDVELLDVIVALTT